MIKIILTLFIISILNVPCYGQSVGSLLIICEPGMRVYIDKELVGFSSEDHDGFYAKGIQAGKRKIVLKKKGYIPRSFVVEILENTLVEKEISSLTPAETKKTNVVSDFRNYEKIRYDGAYVAKIKQSFLKGSYYEHLWFNLEDKEVKILCSSNLMERESDWEAADIIYTNDPYYKDSSRWKVSPFYITENDEITIRGYEKNSRKIGNILNSTTIKIEGVEYIFHTWK